MSSKFESSFSVISFIVSNDLSRLSIIVSNDTGSFLDGLILYTALSKRVIIGDFALG